MKLSELEGCAYAGIGARKTPKDILDLMKDIAVRLNAKYKMILRSGGATGADSAFELGSDLIGGKKEIFIPWEGFEEKWSHGGNSVDRYILVRDKEIRKQSFNLAQKFHDGWNMLSDGECKLMIRNTYQVLGENLSNHSKFVLCWTPDAADGKKQKTSRATGGTGQAIRIAAYYDIPVLNLCHPKERERWEQWAVRG